MEFFEQNDKVMNLEITFTYFYAIFVAAEGNTMS